MVMQKYQTKPLECWGKAKELREKYYRDYAEAKAKGGYRWAGSGIAFDPLVESLGDNFYHLTGEPYGASCSVDVNFSIKCMEATERKGFARDLCAYLRNYYGSMLINQYAFGGEFPKPDFCFTSHICCTHGKWYQWVAEHDKVPYFAIDYGVGLPVDNEEQQKSRIKYVVEQCYDAIEWLEKITGKKCDDERLINAVQNEIENGSLWSKICFLNKAIPAPIDEKSLYSFYVLLVLMKTSPEVGKLYGELKDELEDRVKNQIAAVGNERFRLGHHSQPPWPFLKVFRYLETFGAVSVGSFYTFGLGGGWTYDEEDRLIPAPTCRERGIELKTREDTLWAMAEWNVLYRPLLQQLMEAEALVKATLSIVRDWQIDGMLMHFNRGCEGMSLHVGELRQALAKANVPVMTYEGNQADDREFDVHTTMNHVDAFMESRGLKKIT